MGIDLKDFYLNHPLPRKEYVRLPINIIPEEFIIAYDLRKYAHNGFVYFAIGRGMYGLPQAGRVANDALVIQLAAAGYRPTGLTHGLFKHDTNSIMFALVVDDFGVQYTDRKDVEHLISALSPHYKYTTDWEGAIYCGIHLKWNYEEGWVDLSMPGYIMKALLRFCHMKPLKPQHAPSKWTEPNYGAKQQYAEYDQTSPELSDDGLKRLQEVVGTLLFYCRAIDLTMHVALGTIAADQAEATELTMEAVVFLLNYCATHPDATLRYRRSGMILHVDSDASYLSEKKARSRVGGFFFLDDEEASRSDMSTPPNGAIHVESKILRNVMSSAAEAEAGGLFHNCQVACGIRTTLAEMGWPQPPTVIECDNTTAEGIANDTVKPKRTKAMDMRFWWVRDRVRQGQFKIQWAPGSTNKADYFTKHFAPAHHQLMRGQYLHLANNMHELECEGVLISFPDALVTGSLFHSSSDALGPACSTLAALSDFCVDITKFLDS
jgi:hypothetical protein